VGGKLFEGLPDLGTPDYWLVNLLLFGCLKESLQFDRIFQ
jgi:hypothetical protein